MCEYSAIANGIGSGTATLADLVGPLFTIKNGALLLIALLMATTVWFVGAERLVRLPRALANRLTALSPEPQAKLRAPN